MNSTEVIKELENLKMSFMGRVALITGASSGIGAATAIHLAKLGATLSLTGRNRDNLNNVAKECKRVAPHKTEPVLLIGEMSNEKDIENIVQSTVDQCGGKLDVLVNNAGIIETGTIETTDLGQFDRIFNVNVRAMYYLTHLAVPYLKQTKGAIVNVSSVNGLRSFAGVLAYNMSKSAVDQFTRCVALEMAQYGVRVNSVNPGVIITNIHKRGGMNDEQYAKFLERTKETHALGRPGTADEVACTIAFLASDQASNITGANIPVDGGRHALCPR